MGLAMWAERSATADTITVCASGCDYSDIQSAIDASANGDVIEIAEGTYAPSATLNTMGKAITIRGSTNLDGTPATVIDGQGKRRVFQMNNGEGPGTVLENLVITGGYASSGGGLYLENSSPTLTNCTVSGNTASLFGGGLDLYYSSPTLTNCTVSGNTATDGGGLLLWGSSPTLTGCLLCANAASSGPQVHFVLNSTLLGEGNCFTSSCEDSDGDGWPDKCGSIGDGVHEVPGEYATIEEAIASAGAGDVVLVAAGTYAPSATLNTMGKAITIRGATNPDGTPATVIDGQGQRGVFLIASGEGPGTVLENLLITGGNANYGGGVYLASSSPTLTNCTVSGNAATNKGGGLYLYYSGPTLTNCTVNGNTATSSSGGGLFLYYSSPTLTSCTVSGNMATEYGGGGLDLLYSSPTLTNCTVSGNTGYGGGGGLRLWRSNSTLTNCTVSGNTANSSAYGGGGLLLLESSPALTGCTVSGNAATNKGGGLYLDGATTAPTVLDSVVCSNTAASSPQVYGSGGGWSNTCISDDCASCLRSLGDLNGDWMVDGEDLLMLLAAWGDPGAWQSDVNGDGEVDGEDLAAILGNWGPLP